MTGLLRHLNGRTGPELLLFTMAKLTPDPIALRVVAMLVHELDVECRERIVIHDHEKSRHV